MLMKLTPVYPKICLKIIRIWQEFERHSAILSTLVIATYSSQAWHFIVKNLLRKKPKKKIDSLDKLELINIWQWCTKNKLVRIILEKHSLSNQQIEDFLKFLKKNFVKMVDMASNCGDLTAAFHSWHGVSFFSFALWVDFTNTFMSSF